jgi:hypothetical protein
MPSGSEVIYRMRLPVHVVNIQTLECLLLASLASQAVEVTAASNPWLMTVGSSKFFHHQQDLSAAVKCEFKTVFSKLQEILHQLPQRNSGTKWDITSPHFRSNYKILNTRNTAINFLQCKCHITLSRSGFNGHSMHYSEVLYQLCENMSTVAQLHKTMYSAPDTLTSARLSSMLTTCTTVKFCINCVNKKVSSYSGNHKCTKLGTAHLIH